MHKFFTKGYTLYEKRADGEGFVYPFFTVCDTSFVFLSPQEEQERGEEWSKERKSESVRGVNMRELERGRERVME